MDYQVFKKEHTTLYTTTNGRISPRFDNSKEFLSIKYILSHFVSYDDRCEIPTLMELINNLLPYQYDTFSISKEDEMALLTNDRYAGECKLLLDKWHLKEDRRVVSVLATNAGIEALMMIIGAECYDREGDFPYNENFVYLDTQMNEVMLIGKHETYIFELQRFPAIERYPTDVITSFLSNRNSFLLEFEKKLPNS